MPILIARSSAIDVCGTGDDLLAFKTSKTSKTVCMYSFHTANYVYDGIIWIINLSFAFPSIQGEARKINNIHTIRILF